MPDKSCGIGQRVRKGVIRPFRFLARQASDGTGPCKPAGVHAYPREPNHETTRLLKT